MKVKIGALYFNTDQITFAKVFDIGIEIHLTGAEKIRLSATDRAYQRVIDVLKSDFIDLGLPEKEEQK